MVTEFIATPSYCIMVPLKITLLSFVYGVTVLMPYRVRISGFLGPLKSYLKKEAAAGCKYLSILDVALY